MLLVSEAGYYCWLRTLTRPNKYDDLLAKIRQIRAENKDYGAFRIYLALQLFHGYTGTYYVILKLCKTHQLMLKKKYHAKGITKADPTAQASENLIQQDFSAAATNQKWLGDITEIPTADAKLYLSAVLDCDDNARMESFFATLKKETVKSMVFRFIEVHDNWKWIDTTNSGYPPLMKRDQYYRNQLPQVI